MAKGKHAGDKSYFRDSNYYNKDDDYKDIYKNTYVKETNGYPGTDNNYRTDSRYSGPANDYNADPKYSNLDNNYQTNNYNANDDYNMNDDNYNEDDYEEEDYDDDYYDDGINFKKIFIVIIAIVIIALLIMGFRKIFSNKDSNEEIEPVNTVSMETSIEGYSVLGKIKIEKLGVEQYILDSTEEKALEKGIGKIYGGTLNNYGNLCLAGHNEDDMFGKLSELEEGDTIILTDKNGKDTEYKVTSIDDTVEPDNLECLLSDDEKVEITLVTCKEGATQRLVVKAEEK